MSKYKCLTDEESNRFDTLTDRFAHKGEQLTEEEWDFVRYCGRKLVYFSDEMEDLSK